ncbi:hypothetical protein EJ04DRAFT_522243 [Polyplosphaeria fusca]|uniref:Uncharacterized protein n=1 Tax=Polyplosphaeria fusca TaxID=682080 RepID=A0A9P4V483_9PLEO|nr:hypothetical protein EJ04DRAFT_522243 [Polyplosphaeria fusca]
MIDEEPARESGTKKPELPPKIETSAIDKDRIIKLRDRIDELAQRSKEEVFNPKEGWSRSSYELKMNEEEFESRLEGMMDRCDSHLQFSSATMEAMKGVVKTFQGSTAPQSLTNFMRIRMIELRDDMAETSRKLNEKYGPDCTPDAFTRGWACQAGQPQREASCNPSGAERVVCR